MTYLSQPSRAFARFLSDSRPIWTTFDTLDQFFNDLDYGFTHDRFEVEETDTAYQFAIPLPGFKKTDVEVEVTDGSLLTVRAKRGGGVPKENQVLNENHTVSRTVTLPSDADSTKIDAKLEDGILTLTIAKTPEAKPRKVTVA